MTIKIYAPVAQKVGLSTEFNERLVRESTWRKVMAVVRAVDAWYKEPVTDDLDYALMVSIDALHKHLKKP